MLKRKALIILPVLAFFFILTLSANATGPLYKTTNATKMSNKFLRGVINVPFCFMEVPKALNEEIKNTDYFTGTITGLGKGGWKSVKRLGYGVFETVTFASPEFDPAADWVDHPIPYKELAE